MRFVEIAHGQIHDLAVDFVAQVIDGVHAGRVHVVVLHEAEDALGRHEHDDGQRDELERVDILVDKHVVHGFFDEPGAGGRARSHHDHTDDGQDHAGPVPPEIDETAPKQDRGLDVRNVVLIHSFS